MEGALAFSKSIIKFFISQIVSMEYLGFPLRFRWLSLLMDTNKYLHLYTLISLDRQIINI